jgi:negative regulator of sigma E activity
MDELLLWATRHPPEGIKERRRARQPAQTMPQTPLRSFVISNYVATFDIINNRLAYVWLAYTARTHVRQGWLPWRQGRSVHGRT